MGLNYRIRTERLKIAPLTLEQLELYAAPGAAFEQKYQLQNQHRQLLPDAQEVLENELFDIIKLQPQHTQYYTFWVLVDADFDVIVGDISFKGPPDARQRLEVGYGILPPYRRQGFATEAVKVFGQLGFNLGANTILAHTMASNYPSIRVLEKSGFLQTDRMGNLLRFELKKMNTHLNPKRKA